MDDLLIRGAQIVDVSGAPGATGDVGVRDGRISAVTTETGRPARRVIDAAGLVLAPGFIDITAQSAGGE